MWRDIGGPRTPSPRESGRSIESGGLFRTTVLHPTALVMFFHDSFAPLSIPLSLLGGPLLAFGGREHLNRNDKDGPCAPRQPPARIRRDTDALPLKLDPLPVLHLGADSNVGRGGELAEADRIVPRDSLNVQGEPAATGGGFRVGPCFAGQPDHGAQLPDLQHRPEAADLDRRFGRQGAASPAGHGIPTRIVLHEAMFQLRNVV